MIVIRLLYNRDTVRINDNGQSDSSMNCCLHLRPESNSKTCKGDNNYRIQLDMVAALKCKLIVTMSTVCSNLMKATCNIFGSTECLSRTKKNVPTFLEKCLLEGFKFILIVKTR